MFAAGDECHRLAAKFEVVRISRMEPDRVGGVRCDRRSEEEQRRQMRSGHNPFYYGDELSHSWGRYTRLAHGHSDLCHRRNIR